jgi:hypothetical protein
MNCDRKVPHNVSYEQNGIVPMLTRREFMLGGTLLLCCGCATVPITGRSQLMLVSQAEETALGA